MKLKYYIIALLLLGLCWSCSEDDDNYMPEKPTTGNVFTVAVGVDSKTVETLGGEDAVRAMLYTNYNLLSGYFGKSGDFNEMHFYMDDFFVFEGSSKGQVERAHPNQDISFIINGNIESEDIPDGFYQVNNTVHLSTQTTSMGSLFAQSGLSYFAYAMGLGRGAIDLSAADVPITNNPIAGREYIAPASAMNVTNTSSGWDDLSVKLINRSGTGSPVDIASVLPTNIDVTIKNLSGVIIPDVNVSVYPVRWGSGVVMSESIAEGKTDSNGKISLSNPYVVPTSIKGENEDYFSNLFVKIEKFNVGNYFFIPISDALLNGLDVGGPVYDFEYMFDLTTLEDMRVTRFTFDDQNDLMANLAGIGVTSNVVYTSDAKIGNGAIQFDGAQHLILDQNDQINAGSDYSVSYWFKTSTSNDSQNALWTMSRWSGNITDDPWLPGGLTFRFTTSGVNYDVGWEGGASQEASVVNGIWHHLVTTVEYTSEDRANISMYINGLKVVSGNNSIIKPTWGQYWDGWTGQAPVDDFVIKIGYSNTNGDAALPFNGVVDDVQVFNQALDNNWVFELYNQQ